MPNLIMFQVMSRIKNIFIFFIILLFIACFSCQQVNITRHQARRIGMDTLYKRFGRDKIDDKKPYGMYKTDTTWVLYPKSRIRKGERMRDSKRGPKVLINRKNGEVLIVF